MEIKLTNVARASLAELEEDYQDFLRTRKLLEWPPEHAYSRRLRTLNRTPNATYATFQKGIESPQPEIAANVILGLVRVTCYLLDRQLGALERTFLEEGDRAGKDDPSASSEPGWKKREELDPSLRVLFAPSVRLQMTTPERLSAESLPRFSFSTGRRVA